MRMKFKTYQEFISFINIHYILILKRDTYKYYLKLNNTSDKRYDFLMLFSNNYEIKYRMEQIKNQKYYESIYYYGDGKLIKALNLETYYYDVFAINKIRKNKIKTLFDEKEF